MDANMKSRGGKIGKLSNRQVFLKSPDIQVDPYHYSVKKN